MTRIADDKDETETKRAAYIAAIKERLMRMYEPIESSHCDQFITKQSNGMFVSFGTLKQLATLQQARDFYEIIKKYGGSD